LGQSPLLPELLDLRANCVLGTQHLPILEVDGIGFMALIASDIGRSAMPLDCFFPTIDRVNQTML
jgi:hypothetical protein